MKTSELIKMLKQYPDAEVEFEDYEGNFNEVIDVEYYQELNNPFGVLVLLSRKVN